MCLFNLLEKELAPMLEELGFEKKTPIFIVSDYAGNRIHDNFDVHSFLITDDVELSQHIFRMKTFREGENIPENSFFDYKKVWQDNQKRRLLPKYLKLVEEINGLLIVFLFDKKMYLGYQEEQLSEILENKDLGKWKPHILRQMVETYLMLSFLCSKLDSKRKTIYWLTDEDSRIGDNDEQRYNSSKIRKFFFSYFKIEPLLVTYSQKDSKYNEFKEDRDIKSIVDLSAGSLLDFIDNPTRTRNISVNYAKWFGTRSGMLVKRNFQLSKAGDGFKVYEPYYKKPD